MIYVLLDISCLPSMTGERAGGHLTVRSHDWQEDYQGWSTQFGTFKKPAVYCEKSRVLQTY
jgi:hypothetical protein